MIDGERAKGLCNEDFIGDEGRDSVGKSQDDVRETKEDTVGIRPEFLSEYGLTGKTSNLRSSCRCARWGTPSEWRNKISSVSGSDQGS